MSSIIRTLHRGNHKPHPPNTVDAAQPLIVPHQRALLLPDYLRPRIPFTLTRPPIRVTCDCGKQAFVGVPNTEGDIQWDCPQCRRHIAFPFHSGPEIERLEIKELPLPRVPWLHKCMGCDWANWLIIPAGVGSLRWVCPNAKCGDKWRIDFDDRELHLYRACG